MLCIHGALQRNLPSSSGHKKTPKKHPVSLIHAAANLSVRPQILARKVRAAESDLSDVLWSCLVHTPEEGPAPNSNPGHNAWGINLIQH